MTLTIAAAILAASLQYGVPPAIIASVIEVESSFDPMAKGAKGEIGLMQIYPKYHTCATFFITRNVSCGAKILADLRECKHNKCDWATVLNRYNMGSRGTAEGRYGKKVLKRVAKWEKYFGTVHSTKSYSDVRRSK